jgi:flagellar hook-associated protein 2
LDDNREFNFSSITSADNSVIRAESGSGIATAGIHGITVSALAQHDILATNTFSSSSADQNSGSAANFVFTVNGTQHTVSLAAGGVSLDKLAEGINAKTADSGVTARVVSTGTDQYRLLMEGQSGSTNSITIDTDLPTTYASTAVTLTVATAIEENQTAAITVDGTTFTTAALSAGATANDIGAAFDALSVTGWDIVNNSGVVTFTKNSAYSKSGETGQSIIATADAPAVTIGGSGSGAVTAAAVDSSAGTGFALADVGNKLKTVQDASLTVNGLAVTRTSNEITDLIPGVTLHLNATSSSAVNINVSRDFGLAKDTIKTVVSAANLFETTLKGLSNSVDGDLANDSTVIQIKNKIKQLFYSESSKAGTNIKTMTDMGVSYDKGGTLLVDDAKLDTAMASYYDEIKDFFSGGTDDHNDYDSEDKALLSALTLSGGLNSADTATITLASGVTIAVNGSAGTYDTAAKLAAAFATQTATGYTISAIGDELIIQSTATGASVTALTPAIATVTTSGGGSATGTAVTFSATENTAGSDGLTRGLAGDLVSLMDNYLVYNGTMDTMKDQFNTVLDQVDTDQDDLNERKTSIENRYSKQFQAMNRIMAEMNALKEYLDAQLEALPNNNKD